MRGGLLEEEYRISFLRGGKASLYRRMVELLSHHLMRVREALEYVERSRSRGLVELQALSTIITSAAGTEAVITADERALASKIQALQSALRITKNEEQRRVILQELSTAHDMHVLKLNALEAELPEYVSLRRSEPLLWADLVGLLTMA